MEKKYNDPTHLRPEGKRLIDAPSVHIDLNAFRDQIKSEITWQKNDRNAITVFKNDTMRLVLVALHKNAVMDEHATDGTINIQLLEGQIEFTTPDKTQALKKDQIVALNGGIPHSLKALEESVFLLTLTNPSLI